MSEPLIPAGGGLRASSLFPMLAALFLACFGALLWLAVLDQQQVVESATRMQELTMPEVVRNQKLARNLEQLRQEGERVFSAPSPLQRQQAMGFVTLQASRPSVLADAEAARLAAEAESFLSQLLQRSGQQEAEMNKGYDDWQLLSERLGDHIAALEARADQLASKDLIDVTRKLRESRDKLLFVSVVVGLFLLFFLFALRHFLIHPLQRIDRALNRLAVEGPAPAFKGSVMSEIRTVEAAIGELHAAMQKNEEARKVLETLANKDGLTGLTNRRHFMIAADAELQRAHRYRRPVTIGMADIDFFKKVNDTYGHAAGDSVLQAFAELTRDTLRQSDLVCRYGGEEFAFLLPESPLSEAAQLGERYRARCESADITLPDGRNIRVTMSMGLADASNCALDEALKRADEALYAAKAQGRNRVVVAGTNEAV